MKFEKIEQERIDKTALNTSEKLKALHDEVKLSEDFDSPSVEKLDSEVAALYAKWLGIKDPDLLKEMSEVIMDTVQNMYAGSDTDGNHLLGLKDMNDWNLHPDYIEQNIRQQAGYAAEVISTAKDNLISLAENKGITTYRTADRLDLFEKYGRYTDKIRMNQNGDVVDRIKVKFAGKDAASCLGKLLSKSCVGHIMGDRISRIEIPKEFYEQIKNEKMLEGKLASLRQQLAKVTELGKTEVMKSLQEQIDSIIKLSGMLEGSTATIAEAIFSRKNPFGYAAGILQEKVNLPDMKEGLEAVLDIAESTIFKTVLDNIPVIMAGAFNPKELFKELGYNFGMSAGLYLVNALIKPEVSKAMSEDTHNLISLDQKAEINPQLVKFGTALHDLIAGFMGEGLNLAELGPKIAELAIDIYGSKAVVSEGTEELIRIPEAGTDYAKLIGGLVNVGLASEAYKTAENTNPGAAYEFLEAASKDSRQILIFVRDHMSEISQIVQLVMNLYLEKSGVPTNKAAESFS